MSNLVAKGHTRGVINRAVPRIWNSCKVWHLEVHLSESMLADEVVKQRAYGVAEMSVLVQM